MLVFIFNFVTIIYLMEVTKLTLKTVYNLYNAKVTMLGYKYKISLFVQIMASFTKRHQSR